MVKLLHRQSQQTVEAVQFQVWPTLADADGFFSVVESLNNFRLKHYDKSRLEFTHDDTESRNTQHIVMKEWDWLVIATRADKEKIIVVYTDDNLNEFFKEITS